MQHSRCRRSVGSSDQTAKPALQECLCCLCKYNYEIVGITELTCRKIWRSGTAGVAVNSI